MVLDWKRCAEAVITRVEGKWGACGAEEGTKNNGRRVEKTVGSVGGVGAKVVLVEAREEVVQLLAKVGGVWGHQ